MVTNVAYFSGIRTEIISLLKKAEKEVLIAMAWFTSNELLDAIILCQRKGVKVKLILLDDIINHCDFGVDFNKFIKEQGSEFYLYPPSRKFMHNKFCIIDRKILVTGSYNWTNYAESRNLENVVVSTDSSLIEGYIGCFNGMLDDLTKVDSFERVTVEELPEEVFVSRFVDMAQEVYSSSDGDSEHNRNQFKKKASLLKYKLPESQIPYDIKVPKQEDNDIKKHNKESDEAYKKDTKPVLLIKEVADFRYPVSRYNIGFKAKLIDKGGKEGLKVLIEKGQPLPYTITRDAKSANSGDYDAMNSTCEFYYGDTEEISDCTKFGDTLTLEKLPKMKEGEVRFKIMITLETSGRLSVKFVCTNTGTGVEGEYMDNNFVDFRSS